MYMLKPFRLLLLSALFCPAALADNATPQQAFKNIAHCVKQRDISACRPWLTTGSLAVYDRFTGYGLMDCLPEDATYVSEQVKTNQAVVRTRFTSQGSDHIARLSFT